MSSHDQKPTGKRIERASVSGFIRGKISSKLSEDLITRRSYRFIYQIEHDNIKEALDRSKFLEYQKTEAW